MNPFWALLLLWLASLVIDRLWFAFDQSMPAWDQADYLNGALGYWHMFQDGNRFTADWWQQFWVAAPKIPPLTYLFTLPFFAIFGPGIKTATLVHAIYTALLLSGVYGLGQKLFSARVGLWAAALCVLLPGLYPLRLEYLLDYPVAAMVTFTFFLMTGWARSQEAGRSWARAIATGFCIGFSILTKQTALLFLLVPLLFVGMESLVRRRWGRFLQWITAGLAALLVIRPWVTANWLLILTSSKGATLDSAVKEGDPSLLSPEAWLFYLKQVLPQVGWPIFVGAIAGFLFLGIRALLRLRSKKSSAPETLPEHDSLPWLCAFVLGAYLLNSLNPNKDARYIVPYLPVLSLFFAYGLSLWPRKLKLVPLGAIALSILTLFLNLVPVGGVGRAMAQTLSPGGTGQHWLQYPAQPWAQDGVWPHRDIIETIIELEPNFQTTLGVLPSTPDVNQHNLSLFGNLADFQVAGRQVGTQSETVEQDVRSLSWFLTKSGDQGSIPEAQPTIVKAVSTSPDFETAGQWPLPDGTEATLWHRRQPVFTLEPAPANTAPDLQLLSVNLPAKVPPGQPVPVTYRWSGSLENLQNTVLALTWQKQLVRGWVHDHAPALGFLRPASDQLPGDVFILTERLAMLPQGDPGEYKLTATALDRATGKPQALEIPATTLTLDPSAPVMAAPELDWISQLRTWAKLMPAGPDVFGPAFEDIGRVNQYVASQDYLNQAEIALRHRLSRAFDEETQTEDAYMLALTEVLRQDVDDAIAALQSVTELDAENPFAHAYLAFVHLYGLQPRAAERALEPAKAKAPDQAEVQILDGVAGLMRGNLWKAWRTFQRLK